VAAVSVAVRVLAIAGVIVVLAAAWACPLRVVGVVCVLCLGAAFVLVRVAFARFSERFADVPGDGATSAVVAALLHPGSQLSDARAARVEDDGRGLCDRVRFHREDARATPEGSLDDRLLRSEMEPADVQHGRFSGVFNHLRHG
jgi:hypothetical protein